MPFAVLLAVISSAVALALLLRLHLRTRSLRRAAAQLRSLTQEQTRVPLRSASPDRALEELLHAVNEDQATRAQAMVSLAAREMALREQIASISHDLRTPLTAILGYLHLLEEEGLSAEQAQEYRAIVMQRSYALRDLITSFYELSRIESRDYPLNEEDVRPVERLRGSLAEVYSDFARSGIALDVELGGEEVVLSLDPQALERVLQNLHHNALKYARSRYRCRSYLRQGADGRERLVLEMGNDMRDEVRNIDIERVFERLYSSDRVRTGQNTGIGLTVVRRLVERMGGEATARLDALDDGSEAFVITLSWPLKALPSDSP